MRYALLFFSWCITLTVHAQLREGNSLELYERGLQLYGVESAMILYDVAEQPNDTLVVIFDRFGLRQTTMEHGEKLYYGIKSKINTKEIIDGEVTFDINLQQKTGSISEGNELIQLAGYKSPEEIFLSRMHQLNAVETGSEFILDRECSVWNYEARGKQCIIWAWNGLFLKHQSPNGTRTALELTLDPTINEMLFVPPTDVALD